MFITLFTITWVLNLVSIILYFVANKKSKGCNSYDNDFNLPLDEKIKRLDRAIAYAMVGLFIAIIAFTLSIINLAYVVGGEGS